MARPVQGVAAWLRSRLFPCCGFSALIRSIFVLEKGYIKNLPGIRSAARLCDVFFGDIEKSSREALFPVGFLSLKRAKAEEVPE